VTMNERLTLIHPKMQIDALGVPSQHGVVNLGQPIVVGRQLHQRIPIWRDNYGKRALLEIWQMPSSSSPHLLVQKAGFRNTA